MLGRLQIGRLAVRLRVGDTDVGEAAILGGTADEAAYREQRFGTRGP